jgi:hypothetical protein
MPEYLGINPVCFMVGRDGNRTIHLLACALGRIHISVQIYSTKDLIMAKTVPNFGTLYAASLSGFKWAPDYRLFVRITPAGGFFKVEIHPPTFNATGIQSGTSIQTSWHSQEEILKYLPVLNKYMGRPTPHEFFMDEDGMELPPAPEAAVEPVKAEAKIQVTGKSSITRTDPEDPKEY